MDNLTVVIPTIKDEILTLDSVPDDVPVLIEREGSLNEARNRGVRNAETDIVAIMDDDIVFTAETLENLIDRVSPDTLVGMVDWDFDLIAGRVMMFHKDLWRQVGGFDERLGSHMGDTEFALKVETHGYQIAQVPQDWFEHREHERSITRWDRVWRTLYIAVKYPTVSPRLLRSLL